MILYLYAFKDKKLGAFSQIYTDNIVPEIEKVTIERGLSRIEDIKKLKAYSDIQVYYLGQWNDESGAISAVAPEFLIDAGDLVYKLLSAIESKEDEKDD